MRILIVGDWHSSIHEEQVFRSMRLLGHDVHAFAWYKYFVPTGSPSGNRTGSFLLKLQNKYQVGRAFNCLNRDLIAAVQQISPEVVFIYRGTHVTAETLRTLKAKNSRLCLVGYNNDDPFSLQASRWMWRHFKESLPVYDLVLAYRQLNIDDYLRAGAKEVKLLRSWFVPDVNFPVEFADHELTKYSSDIVFVGHFEPDVRIEYLDAVAKQGYNFRIYGPNYPMLPPTRALRPHWPVAPVMGAEYNKVISGAKVALCFFSSLNRDNYTRRVFEIPASRTLLVSQYTDELASMFSEDIDAVFFRCRRELLEKVDFYLRNPHARERIARSGFERVYRDGHDVVSRVQLLLGWVEQWGTVTRKSWPAG